MPHVGGGGDKRDQGYHAPRLRRDQHGPNMLPTCPQQAPTWSPTMCGHPPTTYVMAGLWSRPSNPTLNGPLHWMTATSAAMTDSQAFDFFLALFLRGGLHTMPSSFSPSGSRKNTA